MSEIPFSKDDRVEVRRPYSLMPPRPGALRGGAEAVAGDCFYPATVLRAPARTRSQILVEYETIASPTSPLMPLREYVLWTTARPAPPKELGRRFRDGEAVEAFVEEGWHPGKVLDASSDASMYLVFLEATNEEAEFAQSSLRLQREWIDGGWTPPFPGQDNFPKRASLLMEPKPGKVFSRLKITFSRTKPEQLFKSGSTVEVCTNEKGYEGSWYTATVVDYLGNGKYLVEYLTLKTEDETAPLREETQAEYLRPYPTRRVRKPFRLLDKVDVWYNDGWWEGVISKVLNSSFYVVYFSTTNEELVFGGSDLRIHEDWIAGKWVISTQDTNQLLPETENPESNIYPYCHGSSETCFHEGMKVEVRSNEVGFQGSMFSAVILGSVGEDMYIVEYRTLKTDDEKEFLRETVKASNLRPYPPEVQKFCGFARLEAVDAWYNEGWWMGYISQILEDSKYQVYFRTSNEEMVFRHDELRPHLEWIGGQWVLSPKDHITV